MSFAATIAVLIGVAFSAVFGDASANDSAVPLASDVKINGKPFSLPTPTLTGSESADQQLAILEELVGSARWKAFSRNSIVAPVKIDLSYLRDPEDRRTGHSIHVAFIIHTSFESLRNRKVLTKLLSDQDESEDDTSGGKKLTRSELEQYGFAAEIDSEEFYSFAVALLKKIHLTGGIRLAEKVDDNQIQIGFRLDERFANPDKVVFNAWSRLGAEEAPAKMSYSGLGGFLTVTRLHSLKNACLIESRILMHEPPEWFSGSNFLRSKLPLMIQELARNFRRRLDRTQ